MEATNVTNILSMDNTQYNLDLSLPQLDSTELADLDISLSENLSSGLSISDSTKVCIILLLIQISIYHLLINKKSIIKSSRKQIKE